MSAERRTDGRSGIGRVLRWTGIVVGALIVAIVAAAFILPRVYPSERIKAYIVPRIESALERDVEVETARVRILPWPSLRLHSFQVANAEGFGPEPVIEGEVLDLNLKLLPLFRREVEIDNIELIESFVRYEVNEEGRTSFSGLGGTDEDADMAPLGVTVSNFRAHAATISYINRSSNRQTRVELDFRADAVPDPETGAIESRGIVTVHSLQSHPIDAHDEPLSFSDLQLEYTIAARMAEDQVDVERLTLSSGTFLLESSGTIENLSTEPRIDLQFVSEGTNLSGVGALMTADRSAPIPLEGRANVDLQVAGPMATPSELTVFGPVELSDVAYTLETFREPLRIPLAELQFGGQDLNLSETPIYLGENQLAASFQVQDIFRVLSAEEERTSWPTARFRLTSDRLDLTDLYAEGDPGQPTYFDLVQARLANEDVAGRDPGIIAAEYYEGLILPPVETTGEVEIGQFVNPPYEMHNLSFQTILGADRLAVENLSGEMYQGTISGQMNVDLSGTQPPYSARYQFVLENGSAGEFLDDWTTLGSAVTGTIDFTLDGRTRIDPALLPVTEATNAEGEALVSEGGFQNLELVQAIIRRLGIDAPALTSFERLGGPYEIREGRFLVDGWMLETNEVEGQLDGSFGFGGDVDLQLGLGMPVSTLQNSRLLDVIGGNIGRLLGRLAGDDEMVEVQIAIGGTMSNPRVDVDTDALQQVLRDLIREAGDRIPDVLRGLR